MIFAVGQRWSFRCDAMDTGATVGIGLIVDDPLPKGLAVHVWIEGLGGLKPELGAGVAAISHTPISRAALERSVTVLVEEGAAVPAGFGGDYQSWLTTEGAGVWDTTLDAIIAIVRKAMAERS